MNKDQYYTSLYDFLIKVYRLAPLWKLKRVLFGIFTSSLKRYYNIFFRRLTVPPGLGISPTMKCNLKCTGCYSRFHSRSDEISTNIFDRFISEASSYGVYFFVITGGEPFMRDDLFQIIERHRNSLFLIVSNGTLIDEAVAGKIAGLNNIIIVLSIEGTKENTDLRRGDGVYDKVINAMSLLRKRDIVFGFSAVISSGNISYLYSDEFIDNMIANGCRIGFYNELIPIGEEELSLVPSESDRALFKTGVRNLRDRKKILLVHLPDDEYDINNRCMAVENGSMHINSQGFVEPCPFAHYAKENIKTHSFRQILDSSFLNAIRKHPDALVHSDIACALVNNLTLVNDLAKEHDAIRTELTDK